MTEYPTKSPTAQREKPLQKDQPTPGSRTTDNTRPPVNIVVTPVCSSPTARRHLVQLEIPPAPASWRRPRRVRISQGSWLLITTDILLAVLLFYYHDPKTLLITATCLAIGGTLVSLWADRAGAKER